VRAASEAGEPSQGGEALVLWHVDGPVARITLNRPDKYNALNLPLLQELTRALDRAEADDGVGAVVLAGAGRAFCAGADIAEMAGLSGLAEAERWVAARAEHFQRLARFPKPVVAALHGFALGGGLELALQADLRVAGESTQLGQPEVLLGLLPGAGGTQRLARLLGPAKALEWLWSGERMTARQALELGLVQRVVPDGEVLAQAHELAARIARQAPLAVRFIKRCVWEGLQMPLAQGLALERQAFAQLLATRDGQEGVRAFLERRQPQFQGR